MLYLHKMKIVAAAEDLETAGASHFRTIAKRMAGSVFVAPSLDTKLRHTKPIASYTAFSITLGSVRASSFFPTICYHLLEGSAIVAEAAGE